MLATPAGRPRRESGDRPTFFDPHPRWFSYGSSAARRRSWPRRRSAPLGGERAFGWLGRPRRLARGYERPAPTLAGWRWLAFLTLLVNQSGFYKVNHRPRRVNHLPVLAEYRHALTPRTSLPPRARAGPADRGIAHPGRRAGRREETCRNPASNPARRGRGAPGRPRRGQDAGRPQGGEARPAHADAEQGRVPAGHPPHRGHRRR